MSYTEKEMSNGMRRIEMEDGRVFHVVTNDDAQVDELVQLYLDHVASDQTPVITYAGQRVQAYPSFADQFDLLYHGGYDAWKAAIDEVKNQFPKP